MIKVYYITDSTHNQQIFIFVRASGPGGQNVNKVATAVQPRYDVCNSPSLPGDVRVRLIRIAVLTILRQVEQGLYFGDDAGETVLKSTYQKYL